jgi:hypothetical protein
MQASVALCVPFHCTTDTMVKVKALCSRGNCRFRIGTRFLRSVGRRLSIGHRSLQGERELLPSQISLTPQKQIPENEAHKAPAAVRYIGRRTRRPGRRGTGEVVALGVGEIDAGTFNF